MFPEGKGGRYLKLTTSPSHVPIVLKSGSLNILKPLGPVQVSNGIALLFLECVLCTVHSEKHVGAFIVNFNVNFNPYPANVENMVSS
jgi:hypothetical protein